MMTRLCLSLFILSFGCGDAFVMYSRGTVDDEERRVITIIDGGTESGAWSDNDEDDSLEPDPPASEPPASDPPSEPPTSDLPPALPPTEQPAPQPEEPSEPPSTALACGNETESEVFALVNQERANAGLAPLLCELQASQVARDYSQTMCDEGFFSHYGRDGSTPSSRLKAQGVTYRGAGENIAMGQDSAQQVMQGWMNSSGHRANILGNYTHIGIGYIACPSYGRHIWTQNFLRR